MNECECASFHGSEANVLATSLGISPEYKQEEIQRWSTAAETYVHLAMAHKPNAARRSSCIATGQSLQVPTTRVRRSSDCPLPSHLCMASLVENAVSGVENTDARVCEDRIAPISLNKVGSLNRSLATAGQVAPRADTTLELEAIAAVHELSFAVSSISVSEILPRTSDLIFVNVTTIEGQPYCLELTLKGWRITSQRSDCMTGDFTRLEMFTKYYDSLYELMDDISPGYRSRFGEKLAQRLKMLQNEDADCVAPCGSYASPPLSLSSAASRHDSSDSLPIVTPVSSPTRDFEHPVFA